MGVLKFNLKFLFLNKSDVFLLLLTILSVNNTNKTLSLIIGMIFFSLSIYFLIKKKYELYFIVLLLNSYQSNGYGIYNLDLTGISPIYFTQLLIILLNLKLFRISKKLLYNFPLIAFIPIYILVGLFNSIDSIYYLKDFSRFFIFFSSLILFTIPEIRLNFLKSFLKYTLIIFPFLLIFNAILSPGFKFGQEQNYFFDEISSVFILTGFSILFHYKLKHKALLWLIFAFLIYIKISFFYFSTIELLALIILISVLILSNIKSIKELFKLSMISLIFIFSSIVIIDFIPAFSAFKFYQLAEAFFVLFNANDFMTFMPFSPKIRILEFINSFSDLISNSYFNLFFGNGFGSFFQYNFYPYEDYGIPTLYDTGSYPDKEIMQNKFFTGHNTLSFILIKMGMISVFVFLRLFIKSLINYFRSISRDALTPVFSIYMLMNLGYGNKNFILIAFMICYLIFDQKHARNSFSNSTIL